MLIDFFKANEQNAPTAQFYLFTLERSCLMNGEFIQQNGQTYQVTGQTIAEQPKANHNGFLFPINNKIQG